MRISDWSSDVCSSDLMAANLAVTGRIRRQAKLRMQTPDSALDAAGLGQQDAEIAPPAQQDSQDIAEARIVQAFGEEADHRRETREIGRASGRERGLQSG